MAREDEAEWLAAQERIYQEVKAKLSPRRRERLEAAKSDSRSGVYAHDLFGAVRAGERAIEREKAGAYLTEVCGGNIFKAVSLLTDAFLDSDPQPSRFAPAYWTPEKQMSRALMTEAAQLPRAVKYSRERREAGGV